MKDAVLKRTGRKQQMWLYGVAVLFCADFVFYGYLPSHKRLQSLREAKVQQSRLIETAAAQSKELPALRTRLESIERIVEHYDRYVPAEESSGLFLQEIARLMTDHHLADHVVVPGSNVQSEDIQCIPVHIDCQGSLKDIFSFFRDLQTMDRLVRILKVALQNDGDFAGHVRMEMNAVIFYRPQADPGVTHVAAGL
ncbi:MAG: type 4a pilus biogenesis protein PilO [Sedimentisphaerales bacterium]|nr:type 4a pilus biogenesis protein PilO [Sedimentisphaerales bacterium]